MVSNDTILINNCFLGNCIPDKQAQDDYVKKSARQLAQLQKLCRTLQAERSSLLDTLKSNNIERPELPELPTEPKDIEPPPKSMDKLDMMSQNCKDLKETLAQLQGQLNAIEKDDKQKGKSESHGSKKAKPKKNKSKNNKNVAEISEHATSDEAKSSLTATDNVPTDMNATLSTSEAIEKDDQVSANLNNDGMDETSTVVCSNNQSDIEPGTSIGNDTPTT